MVKMPKLSERMVLARSRARSLDSVKKLNCWATEIDDITIIKKLNNAEIVSLSCNKITSLEPFQHCYNLKELYIRKNQISNLSEICYLQECPNLRVLWLSDNPCAIGDLYRSTVLRTLPNLEKLDNIAIQEDEKNEAVEVGAELSVPDPPRPQMATSSSQEDKFEDPRTLTLDETNKIRAELGLKPLPVEKVSPAKQRIRPSKGRNSNLVQAVLLMLDEIDEDGLETIGNAIKDRLETSPDILSTMNSVRDGIDGLQTDVLESES
ncbi:cilia- and flagella-associated protein 410-like [Lineus longissimus]|uniref:cilia- and flagella-associated protein 410-like n=1 Tax=Lineus longissimus TaxID=88925 RepID=UPI002B4E7AC3